MEHIIKCYYSIIFYGPSCRLFQAHKEARTKTARRNGTINESTAQKGSLEQNIKQKIKREFIQQKFFCAQLALTRSRNNAESEKSRSDFCSAHISWRCVYLHS